MTREECMWWVNHLFNIAKELEWNKGYVEDAKEVESAQKMAIEALEEAEINCVHCPQYYETEDDTGVHSHCGSHGRLIDADALSRKLCGTTIFIKDGEVFQRMINDAPTVSAEAVQGEWIKTSDGNGWNEWYVLKCPICGATIEDKHYHSWKYNFCPNCGAKMTKGGDSE